MEEIYDAGTITDAVNSLPLSAVIIKKMSAELKNILTMTSTCANCEVYLLITTRFDNYPILGYGDVIIGHEIMEIGDAWKVGKTCCGENVRYKGKVYYVSKDGRTILTDYDLLYKLIYSGTDKQVLLLEQILIYTYPLWSNHSTLLRPPGRKIYR